MDFLTKTLMDLTHIYERTVDPEGQDSLARIGRLVTPGSTVLELGPATGYFTRHLSESLGCTVDCIEYSPEMAEMARPFWRGMHSISTLISSVGHTITSSRRTFSSI